MPELARPVAGKAKAGDHHQGPKGPDRATGWNLQPKRWAKKAGSTRQPLRRSSSFRVGVRRPITSYRFSSRRPNRAQLAVRAWKIATNSRRQCYWIMGRDGGARRTSLVWLV